MDGVLLKDNWLKNWYRGDVKYMLDSLNSFYLNFFHFQFNKNFLKIVSLNCIFMSRKKFLILPPLEFL